MQPTREQVLYRFSVAALLLVGYAPFINAALPIGFVNNFNLINVSPRIIGGETTQIEKVPYQISIEMLRMHVCGGAIISDTWILTAAHCVDSKISGPTFFKRIRAGSTWEIPIVGNGGTIHSIASAQFHPKWAVAEIDYDVGVIKVSNKFEFSPKIQAIALPTETEDAFVDYKLNATVSGWGRTNLDSQNPSFQLKRVDIPLMKRDKCTELLKGQNFTVTSRHTCAGGTGKGGPCNGDSGGPLVHKGKLIGLTSFAVNQCNDAHFPSGFSNLFDGELRAFVKQLTGL